MRHVAILTLALALAACATPRERCMAEATRDLRIVERLIADLEATIARGYAIETVRVPRTRQTLCTEDGVRRLCRVRDDRLLRRPVAVDLDAARATLASLLPKRDDLARRAEADLAACAALADAR